MICYYGVPKLVADIVSQYDISAQYGDMIHLHRYDISARQASTSIQNRGDI